MIKQRYPGLPCAVVAVAAAAILCGCERDARLADHTLRDPEVKTVTHYGMTLDEKASPEQVAYVLLMALRDDFLAPTDEERQRALDVQFDLCAADTLEAWNTGSLSRSEFIFEVVYHWTPTVSHYVNDFATQWEKAKTRLVATRPKPAKGPQADAMECTVMMELNDPSGDANARVVMLISLVQEKGYWRVRRIGFDPSRRTLKDRSTTPNPEKKAPATTEG